MMEINKTPPEEIKIKAALETVDFLIEQGDIDEDDRDECAKQIANCCRGCLMDGYDLAQELDNRYYWDITALMVETLDSHGRTLEKHRDEWLKETTKDIKPPFEIGAHVKWRDKSGVIDGIYEYRPASYTVKEDGDIHADVSSRRVILWFDQVEAA